MNAAEYAALLKDPRRPAAWSLRRIQDPSPENHAARFKGAMDFLGEQDLFRKVVAGTADVAPEIAEGHGFAALLDALAAALAEDLRDYAGPVYADKLAQTHVAFLPMRDFNGYCIDRDDRGAELGGFLIALHDGLYFSAKLLAKALVLESLEGDLARHRSTSSVAYNAAAAFFARPEVGLIGGMDFDDFEPELQGVLSAVQTSAAMVMLQFVALHEFAHAAADDHALMALYGCRAAAPSAPAEAVASMHWTAEFRADEQALRWLCSAARPPKALWTNAAAVYLFFEWLADVEEVRGRPLCRVHPPPAARAERVLELAGKILPPSDDAANTMEWARAAARKWRQSGG